MQAVLSRSDQGRIARGRDYAAAGHVVDLKFLPGAIHGRVAGSQNDPFLTSIILPYRSKEQLAEVSELLASAPSGLSRARRGIISDDILNLLLWADAHDARFGCDCPDPVTACKHIVAVAECVAAKMDSDPSIIFTLRGLTLDGVEKDVVERSEEVARGMVESPAGDFWAGGPLPDLPQPKKESTLSTSDLTLLHKAMRHVSYTSIDELRAVSDVEDMFDHLTR
ncbi:hypothetical protein CUTER_04260 [Corynebacterium uterequi]|uniref:SWIM-type domain-containing protein n=2 Tax=Corynebacterium uterequi TaxID=1072256 RepID=A0A0G3HFX3_9CORY|nr:hypothetical protein CUTER_04260 [Corynebacterium uterequi]